MYFLHYIYFGVVSFDLIKEKDLDFVTAESASYNSMQNEPLMNGSFPKNKKPTLYLG